MIKDANYRSTMGQITKSSTYDIIETIDPIAAAVQYVTSNYVEQIALVTITLHFENRANSDPGCSPPKASTPYLASQTTRADHSEQERGFLCSLVEKLRPLVRKTDGVFLLGQTSYFLLPGADQQGAQIVQSRLWEAMLWHINHSEVVDARALRAHHITIGHSAYPVPHVNIGKFIKGASKVVLRFELQLERSTRKVVRSHQSSRQDATSKGKVFAKASLAASVQNDPPEHRDRGESEALPVLARKLGIPYLTLLPKKLPEDLQQLVNPQLARELHCYPLGRERNMLTVAMLNPQDSSALDRLQRETGLHIFPVLTYPDALQTALEQLVC
jgi:Type II secretion system (T2SS), protein E, N-terminal domain